MTVYTPLQQQALEELGIQVVDFNEPTQVESQSRSNSAELAAARVKAPTKPTATNRPSLSSLLNTKPLSSEPVNSLASAPQTVSAKTDESAPMAHGMVDEPAYEQLPKLPIFADLAVIFPEMKFGRSSIVLSPKLKWLLVKNDVEVNVIEQQNGQTLVKSPALEYLDVAHKKQLWLVFSAHSVQSTGTA